MSYLIAVSSSVSVALGIRHLFSGYTKNLRGSKLFFINTISSFFACSSAGALNTIVMRRTEMKHGIEILDDERKVHGKS